MRRGQGGWVLVGLAGLGLGGLALRGWLAGRPAPATLPSMESVAERDEAVRHAFARRLDAPVGDGEISTLFAALFRALAGQDGSRAADSFDADRLAAEATQHPLDAPVQEEIEAREIAARCASALSRSVEAGWPLAALTSLELRHIDRQPGGGECVVYARHRSADGDAAPARWWLVRGRAGWLVYDVEDCRTGWRLSTQLAPLLSGRLTAAQHQSVQAALLTVQEAGQLLSRGRTAEAKARLAECDPRDLPPGHQAHALALKATIALALGDDAGATAALRAAEVLGGNSPALDLLTAEVCLRQEKWGEAARLARQVTERLGPDPRGSAILTLALRELGQPDAAGAVLREALDEYPTSAALRRLAGGR